MLRSNLTFAKLANLLLILFTDFLVSFLLFALDQQKEGLEESANAIDVFLLNFPSQEKRQTGSMVGS